MDPVVAYIYLYVLLLPILDAGGFYYTYRVRKITGAFRGWNLLLLFVVLFCVQGLGTFVGGAITAVFYPSLIDAYVARTGAASIISSSSYNLVVAAVLLAAMFEINRVFRKVQGQGEKDVPQTPNGQ
jgi:hypothetical protein